MGEMGKGNGERKGGGRMRQRGNKTHLEVFWKLLLPVPTAGEEGGRRGEREEGREGGREEGRRRGEREEGRRKDSMTQAGTKTLHASYIAG